MEDVSTDRMPLRRGGHVWIDEGTLHVTRDDGEDLTVPGEEIRKIKLQVVDWGLAVFSVATVAFGAYFATVRHPLGGLAFALVGVWSLYRLYRERNTLVLWVEDRSKAIALYPENPEECHAAVARVVRPDETPVTEES